MSKELFGTDGIRGEVGKHPLTQDAVFAIGKALATWLKELHPQEDIKVVVGKDTRESGEELEAALLAGAGKEGVEGIRLGTAPTPTVSFLTRSLKAHLGIAISASHNPGSDNGIKFFNSKGYKLFPEQEKHIEEIFSRLYPQKNPIEIHAEALPELIDYFPRYLKFAKEVLKERDLSSLKIVLDCAYGSFSEVAPKIFQALKAEIIVLHNEPDGTNINVDCGTLHPEVMAKAVKEHNADMGIAFDGDGDRVILADENAKILDGDHIMAILGMHLLAQNRLAKNLIICTQMTNIGLELFLEQQGIKIIRTPVGDKYVLQEMLKTNAILGGEQSGHIILMEQTPTGDGLIAALELIKVMLETKKQLSELDGKFQKFPQILVNIKVREKIAFDKIEGFSNALTLAKNELGKTGRVFVRYSGTEKLARVMIEAKEQEQVERIATDLALIIENAIGVK